MLTIVSALSSALELLRAKSLLVKLVLACRFSKQIFLTAGLAPRGCSTGPPGRRATTVAYVIPYLHLRFGTILAWHPTSPTVSHSLTRTSTQIGLELPDEGDGKPEEVFPGSISACPTK